MNVSSWYSLRLRLPLMMSALVAAVLTTFVWVAYRQVERALARAGGARAEAAADQIATLLAQLAQQRIVELQRAAQSAAVVDYLTHPGAATAAAAHERLLALTAPNQPPVEVWDDMGTRLMVVTGPNASDRIAALHLPPTTPPSTAGTSPFQVSHDTIFWEGVAVIGEPSARDAPSAPHPKRLGYVLSRRLLGAAATPGAISRLVGSGAVVAMGNRAGNAWTDLSKVIAPPPVDTAHHGMAEYTRPDGEASLGAAAPIAGTAWAAWVELPRRMVVAPARVFLTRMILVGIAFVIAAAIVAGTISARITTPLRGVTSAAEAIAAGAPGTRVAATRRDEIGRLGVAFNTMAEQVQGVQRDLEQRVEQRVTELRATRRELDGFFANSLDMLCIVGADGYFKRLNPAWSATLGWSEHELRSRPYLDFVHPDDLESTRQKASLLCGSQVVEFENRYACRDGSYRWLQWKGAASPEHDFVYAAARDISEQKETDARIRGLNAELGRRVSDLNALTQELEAFSYSVSHDLRAPLRHITGFAAMLDESAGAALDDQGRRYVRVISESASRMGRLIDDLLIFSRMGRTEMTRGRVDLATLVEDVRRDVSAGLNGRVVNWNVHPLPVVCADASTLRQVLTNLMSNALKYSGARPVAEIEIGHHATPAEHVIFVRDNGVGFDMKYVHKLFGVFQRLHSSDDFEGTGIGLANVRRIVHRHGGRVWAESDEGHGATFFFSLPNTGEGTV